jgi:acyl dehydratase
MGHGLIILGLLVLLIFLGYFVSWWNDGIVVSYEFADFSWTSCAPTHHSLPCL